MMNKKLGYFHFWVTFISAYGVFFPMHFLGLAGLPRRYYTNSAFPMFDELTNINEVITFFAIIGGLVQLLFIFNFFYSIFKGQRVGRTPGDVIRSSGSLLVHRLVMETLTPSRLYIVVLTNTVLPKLIPTITHRPNHLRKEWNRLTMVTINLME